MQAYSLVADDIMDSSITRRGQLCWYRQDGVGLRAINDVLVMEGAVFQIIRKRFRTEPFYVDLIDLLREVCHVHPFSISPFTNTFRSCIEQKWDNFLTLLPLKKTMWISPSSLLPGLSSFSRLQHLFEMTLTCRSTTYRHSTTVLYKTALFSFYLPVALALLLCGFPVETRNESDPDYYKIALAILVPLGEYFQIQDDYLDYAGTPEQIGKIGTDIVDNKCSWCINTALALANPTQRAILDANYGRKNPEAERRVKEVFREVGVDAAYREYEAQSYARLTALIDAAPEVRGPNGDAVLRQTVFHILLEKIYKRTK